MEGFPRFDRDHEVTLLPPDLAAVLAAVAARQAASPTAVRHARLTGAGADPTLFAPVDGAFNGPVADAVATWKDE